MEQQEMETNGTKQECKCALHPFWKYLFLGLAVFLGSFCAAYAVIDWHMKSFYDPFQPSDFIFRNEQYMQEEFRDIDRLLKADEKFIQNGTGIIHAIQKDNMYDIIINLKPFDNNPDNVVINTDKNTLDISAKSVNKSEHEEHISNFQQSYAFGDNVNLSKMKKTVKDNNLIITVPIETKSNED